MKQMEAKCRETVATREAVEEEGGKVPPEDNVGHYHFYDDDGKHDDGDGDKDDIEPVAS